MTIDEQLTKQLTKQLIKADYRKERTKIYTKRTKNRGFFGTFVNRKRRSYILK